MELSSRAVPVCEGGRPIAGVIMVAMAGSLSLGVAPFIVTTLTGSMGFSSALAGLCVSSEMAGNAVAIAVVLYTAARYSARRVCMAALGLIVVANIMSSLVATAPLLAALRFLAGFGCGLTTISYGLLGLSRTPARGYALNSVVLIATAALLGACVPWLSQSFGAAGLFVVFALAALVSMSTLRLVPAGPLSASEPSLPVGAFVSPTTSLRALLRPALMMFLFFISIGTFWVYLSTIGRAHGLDDKHIASGISASFLIAGLAGNAIAPALARYIGSRAGTAICIVVAGVAIAMLGLISGPAIFSVTVLVFLLAWLTAFPMLMALVAEMDRSGRLPIIGMLIQMVALVIGPAVAGPLLDAGRLIEFEALCIVGLFLSLLLLVGRRSIRSEAQN